jgi:hypothetical protein
MNMPCQDPYIVYEADPEIKARLDRATQYLCFMIGESKLAGTYKDLPTKIRKWSMEHDESDTKRVKTTIRNMIKRGAKSPFIIANRLVEKAKKVHPVSDYHADWFYDMAKQVLKEK